MDLNNVSVNETEYLYYGAENLLQFDQVYRSYHGFIATVVCVFGIIANILNIVVLTRRNMISATNYLLTALAISDGLTMAAYLPFAVYFYCLYGTQLTPERNTYGAICFLFAYACFSVVVHTISIWLTVTLAVFRYIFVRHPRRGQILCSTHRATIAIILVCVTTIVICIPNFTSMRVVQQNYTSVTDNSTEMWVVMITVNTVSEKFVSDFNFWVQAILVKLCPCVALTILSLLLVNTMQKAQERRRNMRLRSGQQGDAHGRERKTNRTTRMLLTVVVLFLITEFPQGILNLLSGVLPKFYDEIYAPLGNFVDILTLINSGINFILFCTMSTQFRETFYDTFLPARFRKSNGFVAVSTNHTKTTMLASKCNGDHELEHE